MYHICIGTIGYGYDTDTLEFLKCLGFIGGKPKLYRDDMVDGDLACGGSIIKYKNIIHIHTDRDTHRSILKNCRI